MAEYDIAQTYAAIGGAGNIPATNQVPVDMHEYQFSAFPQDTPLTVILGKLAESSAKNLRVDWMERQEFPTTLRVAGNLASGGTALICTNHIKSLPVDTLLYNPRTFDQARVSVNAQTDDTTCTIVRSTGGTTAAAWVVGDILHVLSTEVPEDDDNTARDAEIADVNFYNYSQLVRLGFKITRSLANLSPYPGLPSFLDSMESKTYRKYRITKEKMLFMGGRATSGTAPATRRQMGGIIEKLRTGTLYKDFGGLVTESGYENWVGDYGDQNPDVTTIYNFLAPNFYRNVCRFARKSLRIAPEAKTYGLPGIQEYMVADKRVVLVPLPLFMDAETRGWGFLLDVQNRMVLKTFFKDTYIPDPGISVNPSERMRGIYRGSWSLIVANETAHSMAVGAHN